MNPKQGDTNHEQQNEHQFPAQQGNSQMRNLFNPHSKKLVMVLFFFKCNIFVVAVN